MSYAAEKIYEAVNCLASGTDPIQQRIECAWNYMCRIRDEHLPNSIKEEFKSLEVEVTGDGGHRVKTSKMTDEQASRHATRIVGMFLQVAPAFFGQSRSN